MNGGSSDGQPSLEGLRQILAAIDFLSRDEPGGIDDVDIWLAITVAMIPVAAIVGIVVHYVLGQEENGPLYSFVSGAGVAVGMFVILYVLYRRFRFDSAPHASLVTYNDLCERMHRLAKVSPPVSDDPVARATSLAAFSDLVSRAEAFDYARKKKGVHWILGKGYVDLARLVHRAEEAAIFLEPSNLVLAGGMRDQSRIEDSTIPHAADLLNRLRRSLITVDPESAAYLVQLPHVTDNRGCEIPDRPLSEQLLARAVLSNVRYTVNEFRDSATMRLIDARNELLARCFLTGLATFLLVVFVVLARPPVGTFLTSAILYAIGATVGLFSRLYADLSGDSFGSDYAISYVRLFQAFLLSGLAALAGVYIAVALPAVLNNPALQLGPPSAVVPTVTVPAETGVSLTPVLPTPTEAGRSLVPVTSTVGVNPPSGGTSANRVPSLSEVYNFDRYPFSLVLAMIFGVTPGLLVSRLSQGIERYKTDLQSSEPATRHGS